MRIRIGSMNPVKVSAVEELLAGYPKLAAAEIVSVELPTGVSEQPQSLEETLRGAINRAKAAGEGFDLGFGIESGLVQVPYTKCGFMNVTTCAIWDGKDYHLGLSSAFECPPEVSRLMKEEGLNLSAAAKKAGLTIKEKVGREEGIISILTGGRLDRKDYTKQALTMAMIHLKDAHHDA